MEDEPLPPGVQSLPKYSSNPVRPDHHFNSSTLTESTRHSTLGYQNASEIETAAQNVVLHEQVLMLFSLIIFIGFIFCSSCHHLN